MAKATTNDRSAPIRAAQTPLVASRKRTLGWHTRSTVICQKLAYDKRIAHTGFALRLRLRREVRRRKPEVRMTNRAGFGPVATRKHLDQILAKLGIREPRFSPNQGRPGACTAQLAARSGIVVVCPCLNADRAWHGLRVRPVSSVRNHRARDRTRRSVGEGSHLDQSHARGSAARTRTCA